MDKWWEKKSLTTSPDDLKSFLKWNTNDAYNEVYPGIFIGDEKTARNKSLLKLIGVTHVVNAAQGRDQFQVNTSKAFYEDCCIAYLGIEALDTDGFGIHRFFNASTAFIKGAFDTGGKVLVHCKFGLSRSATLVLAYLMMEKRLSARRAVQMVSAGRSIHPNDGFLLQLCVLNDLLALR